MKRVALALLGLAAFTHGACDAGSASDPTDGADADAGAGDAEVSRDPIVIGERAVRVRGCPNCHQSPDPNDGLLSGTTTPRLGTLAYPANLTPDMATGIGTWTNAKIVRAIHLGIDNEDQPLCAQMTRFDRMGDDEAYAIVAYLRSLPPVHHQIPESTCPPLKPGPMERDK